MCVDTCGYFAVILHAPWHPDLSQMEGNSDLFACMKCTSLDVAVVCAEMKPFWWGMILIRSSDHGAYECV